MTNPSDLKNFTTVDTEIAALEAGSIDAVIIDSGPATSIAAGSSGALKVAGTIIANENRLRLSVSVFNTHEDIDRVVEALGGRKAGTV